MGLEFFWILSKAHGCINHLTLYSMLLVTSRDLERKKVPWAGRGRFYVFHSQKQVTGWIYSAK